MENEVCTYCCLCHYSIVKPNIELSATWKYMCICILLPVFIMSQTVSSVQYTRELLILLTDNTASLGFNPRWVLLHTKITATTINIVHVNCVHTLK
jgi:hypothetical protein